MTDAEKDSPGKMSVGRLIATLNIGQLWGLIGVSVTVVCGAFGLGYTINSWTAQGEISEARAIVTELEDKIRAHDESHEELQTTHAMLKVKENVLRLFHFYNGAKLEEQEITSEVALARQRLDNLFPFPQPSLVPVLSPAARLEQRRKMEAYEKKKEEYYEQLQADGKAAIDDVRADLKLVEEELHKMEIQTVEHGSAIQDLLDSQEEKSGHIKVTFAKLSKGSGGTGTIKLAYDGMKLAIPNEFLPVAAH